MLRSAPMPSIFLLSSCFSVQLHPIHPSIAHRHESFLAGQASPTVIYLNDARFECPGLLCPFTSAQARTTKFTNAWLSSYVVGLTYQITWTIGNGRPISLVIFNSTWTQVFEQDTGCSDTSSSSFPSSTNNDCIPVDRAFV